MKILAKMRGGSHAYGLATPASDQDIRFVFLNTDVKHIIGLDKHENQQTQNEEKDEAGFELRRFFQLLRKTNTTVMEILFNQKWLEVDRFFQSFVLDHKEQFLDTGFFFKSLMGYIQGEKRLMNGERTGKLGSKRKTAIETYGYSYKNAVQILRLIHCGIAFFSKGYYPVNIFNDDPALASELLLIKTKPHLFKVEELNDLIDEKEKQLKAIFDSRDKSKDFKFNEDYANEVIFRFYFSEMQKIDFDYYVWGGKV